MAAKSKVVIIGGAGLLGAHLTTGLLEHGGYEVTILTREGGDQSKLAPFVSKGAKVVTANVEDEASLTAAFQGQDIVLSAVGSAALAGQTLAIKAATAAGVRRFVPSEFGLDTGAPGIREYFPALGYKFAVRDALEASGLEWTYVVTGFFMETQFSPYFNFDAAAGKLTVKGNPDAKFAATSLKDVGRWTAEALLDPASKNTTIYLRGSEVSYNSVIKTYESTTGKKLEVTHVSSEELNKQIEAHPSVWAAFVDLLLKAISEGWGNQPADKLYRGSSPEHKATSLTDFFKAASQWMSDV
mmetsp:Transcript_5008/g.10831  ORF Transcript_5008/g.10831 Transcript_5008/m.10831 type:complete len:299 (-) Transcript_5008:484-1380(-)|eukprot:CAMPEP_0202900068 /NCGR_PEP_ID=MMETSP1392-20130828/9635_1 /ASSEMBLY_ACC=CAM_ASM_000868 /TAXON_ID=225041 /ORGANISM="Chlamydomonas chlamydogama, Strain SAG 11-48b" /LENGTH=298 /DNA_ID=CAMNT_0049586385 /DNA_START=195 /DNA_END=1091 /DNA_ORIENTATION=-